MPVFDRTPYGKEHKLVIKHRSKPKIHNAEVLTFEEEFQHYCNMCMRTKKFQKWATPAGFQLEYDSDWKDLQAAYYVYPGNQEAEDEIKKKFKVIEVN
jgi:hypothetical protein